MGIATLVIVFIAVGLVAGSLFRPIEADNIMRFCMEATADRVIPGPGEVGGSLDGTITLDMGANTIDYLFNYNESLSAILALVVRGPRPAGQFEGPVLFSLCGSPNLSRVCDITTTPGEVTQTGILQLEPGLFEIICRFILIVFVCKGALDTRPILRQIMLNPPSYYLEVRTADHPTSPGALRAPFAATCGFP